MLKVIRDLTWRDGFFSLKTFAAAMLALYIAFRLNLLAPSWSVTTVYVVSQPLAGMVLAKSAYRVLGTVIGAMMSLVFVALFSNAPELFCLALALWIGTGTFVSIYLGDVPMAYAGMLAGYSAAIIGLPAALAPDNAFDLAVGRCLEIMLGIACGALVHHVVFPRRAGEVLDGLLDAALPTMARWAGDALRGRESGTKGVADQRQLVSAVVALDSMRVFAVLDTPAIKAVEPEIRRFEGKLLSLMALLFAVHDRLALLRRRSPAAADALRPLLEHAAAQIVHSAGAATPGEVHQTSASQAALLADIESRLPSHSALRTAADAFLVRIVLLRLRDVLEMWHAAVSVRGHIATGARPAAPQAAPAFERHHDVVFALIGAAISTIAVLVASAFWILTAWPNGTLAVTFAGIMCALLGARDDPATASAGFLRMSVVGAVIAGLYLFVLLPPLSTFAALVIALAPLYLVCGVFLTARSTTALVMPVIFIGGALIGLSNAMEYDFASFANDVVGYLVGIGIGTALLGLSRPIGTEWAVRRLTRSLMADLARMAGAAQPDQRAAFESRMFDRINELFARLDPTVDKERAAMQSRLASLRVGLNIVVLQTLRPQLPAPAAAAIAEVLGALAQAFGRAARRGQVEMPLALLDAARGRMMALDEAAEVTRAAEALYSIEITLRQHPDLFGSPAPALSTAGAASVTA